MNKKECLENKKAMIQGIKNTLDTHSRFALELDANKVITDQEYDGEDLMNISLLFSHIVGNMSIGYLIRKGFTEEQMGKIAMEIGENIRQTVLLGTGIDTHALTKRLLNKK